MSKDSPAPPASPDYQGIARTQARASNPNITNPLGSQRVTWDGDIPSILQTLTPEQQALLSRQQGLQGEQQKVAGNYLTGLAGQGQFNPKLTPTVSSYDLSGMERAPQSIGTTGQVTQLPDAERIQFALDNSGPIQRQVAGPEQFAEQGLRAQNAILARQEPLLQRQADLQHTQLANQGIPIGSEAYIADENQLARNRTDAEQQAILAGNTLQQQQFGMGLQSGQFANQAQAQRFGQNMGQGQFWNQSQGQQFGQNLSAGQFTNQALQNQFGQNLAAGQYAQQGNRDYVETARQQANLANGLNQQQFNQQLASYQLPAQMYANLQGAGNVQLPQFQQFQNPNYMQGAQQQAGYDQNVYNQQVGSTNAQNQGMYTLATTAAMYF